MQREGQERDITIRQVTAADWQDYRDYYKGLSDPHHFSGFLNGKDLDARQTYDDLFAATVGTGDMVMFGLWDGDRMIGQSSISFLDTPEGKIALLAGSEIADEYRGQRLVDRFYDARMQYIRDSGFEGTIQTTIRPDNISSQKAAGRNGFVNTQVLDSYGYYIFRPGTAAVKTDATITGEQQHTDAVNDFSGAAERVAEKNCVVNYVWINKDRFAPQEGEPPCGVPLHYVDEAIANARRYPQAQFQVWVDSRFLDKSSTMTIVDDHIRAAGIENLAVRDLSTVGKDKRHGITDYEASPYFSMDSGVPVWHRVDVARLMVTEHTLQEKPGHIAVYADFDVVDVRLGDKAFMSAVTNHGFVLGSTKEPGKEAWPENGYFAFSGTENARGLLSSIMHNVYEATAQGVKLERNDVFNAYFKAILDYCEERKIEDRQGLLLTGVLEPTQYVIPHNPRYKDISV